MKAGKYILLMTLLIASGVMLFFAQTQEDLKATPNTQEAVQAYASSTQYILLEEEAIVLGEAKQSEFIKADQRVMDKYKNIFDE